MAPDDELSRGGIGEAEVLPKLCSVDIFLSDELQVRLTVQLQSESLYGALTEAFYNLSLLIGQIRHDALASSGEIVAGTGPLRETVSGTPWVCTEMSEDSFRSLTLLTPPFSIQPLDIACRACGDWDEDHLRLWKCPSNAGAG